MSNRLFIMGMFRSGTTLIARMLHTHDDIVCASDPFRPFFNAFRDDVALDIGAPVAPFDPLGDYFGNAEQLALFEAIQEADLDRPFPEDFRRPLLDRITTRAEPFSPKIVERLDGLDGETFHDVFDNLLTHVPAAYGEGHESWEATKEVWTTEFTPVLARAYPESKFLHVIRDPRGVAASKNVQKATKYPWLFIIRQWRKLAILSHVYNAELADRVHLVRYEDLVHSPRTIAAGICSFLDIKLDESMLNPSNFVDGAGEQWLQNTSYNGSSTKFDTSSVEKWQDTLSERETKFIEQLTYPAMLQYGYDPVTEKYGLADEFVVDPPSVPKEELADWIQEYYSNRYGFEDVVAVSLERTRQDLLQLERGIDSLDTELVKAFFLNEGYAQTAEEAIK